MSSISIHHTNPCQKTKIKSGSDPGSLSSDDYYLKIYGTVSSFLSFVGRNVTLLPDILAKGKVKDDEQRFRSERLIPP